MKCDKCGSEVDIVAILEAREKAYKDAVDASDLESMKRFAPRGKTYGEVVKSHSKEETQRIIDAVNKARGVL